MLPFAHPSTVNDVVGLDLADVSAVEALEANKGSDLLIVGLIDQVPILVDLVLGEEVVGSRKDLLASPEAEVKCL